MKQILTSKLLRKVMILSFLIVGLMFVVSSDNVQTVEAARCCYECPGGGDPVAAEEACFAACGNEFNTCFYNCRNRAFSCYATCSWCGGGGGFDECQFDTQCPPGNFCVNNQCQ